MLINIYSIALSMLSIVVLFFFLRSLAIGYRIVRYFNREEDSKLQIRLEDEGLLSSALIQFCCLVQIGGTLLFILAADDFSSVLAGAMCSTGSLLANEYGFPTLIVKLTGIFFYGFWIVLHRIDLTSPSFPLMKLKHAMLFLIFPLFLTDAALQTLYLANLTPDLVTSCCGTIFTEKGPEGFGPNLVFSTFNQFLLLFGGGTLLGIWSFIVYRLLQSESRNGYKWFLRAGLAGWSLYGVFGMTAIILTISSYVYAMPYHNCPFCMLKAEYYFFGYPLYLTFFGAIFCGISSGLLTWIQSPEIQQTLLRYQAKSMQTAAILILCFMILAISPVLLYRSSGADIFF